MASAFSAGPPEVLVKLITPPEKEEGHYAFFGFFIFKVNRPVHFLFQRISGSIQPRLRKDGKQPWKNAGFS